RHPRPAGGVQARRNHRRRAGICPALSSLRPSHWMRQSRTAGRLCRWPGCGRAHGLHGGPGRAACRSAAFRRGGGRPNAHTGHGLLPQGGAGMNKTAYPNLGEQVYEGRTASGLLVRVVPKPGFAKIYGFLAVDYGSMDTTFWKDDVKMVTPQGVAHYLEQKMFDMPSGSAMQDFSRYGGNPNAFTSYDMMAYYV